MLDLNTNPCALMPRKKRRSKFARRPYIRLTLKNENSSDETLESFNQNIISPSSSTQTIYAFDQLFISEQNSMRVSYFELQIDNPKPTKQKNSGIHLSIKEPLERMETNATQLNDILSLFQEFGFVVQAPKTKIENMDELCEKLEQTSKTKEKELGLSYRLKEPVFNSTFQTIPDRGQVKHFWLRSKCTNGQILVDKQTIVPFEFGAELLIEFCSNYASG